jgi:hypothetical protein
MASCNCWDCQFTVSEKVVVYDSDHDVAVTVTVDVTGWNEVTMEEAPQQPLRRLADSGQHTYGQQKKHLQAPPLLPGRCTRWEPSRRSMDKMSEITVFCLRAAFAWETLELAGLLRKSVLSAPSWMYLQYLPGDSLPEQERYTSVIFVSRKAVE